MLPYIEQLTTYTICLQGCDSKIHRDCTSPHPAELSRFAWDSMMSIILTTHSAFSLDIPHPCAIFHESWLHFMAALLQCTRGPAQHSRHWNNVRISCTVLVDSQSNTHHQGRLCTYMSTIQGLNRSRGVPSTERAAYLPGLGIVQRHKLASESLGVSCRSEGWQVVWRGGGCGFEAIFVNDCAKGSGQRHVFNHRLQNTLVASQSHKILLFMLKESLVDE